MTHLLTLVQAMARKLGVEEAELPELDELTRMVEPEPLLDEIEQRRPS